MDADKAAGHRAAVTVHRVVIQLRKPSGSDPGQVSDGFYTITDGVLTMTRPDGEPVDPEQFRHTLKPGDDANAIAGMLTHRVRKILLGITDEQAAFGRRLDYPSSGVA